MSRTYRKSSVTEEESLVKYINRQLNYINRRSFYYEYYITDEGQKAYDKAVEEWEIEYYNWLYNEKKYTYFIGGRTFSGCQPPKQPTLFYFKKARVVYRDIDYRKEVEEAIKEYNRYKRDGRFYDGNRNRSFRKHCARDLRHFNRELAPKIIKGDDSWEDKPYPDTYLGKKHIWDYW